MTDVEPSSPDTPSWKEIGWKHAERPVLSGRRALVGPALLVVTALLVWRSGKVRTAELIAAAAVVLAVVLAASPRLRTLVGRVSERVTAVAATVLSFVLLVPAYYLVVFPLGVVMRLFGGRPLDLSLDAARSSYWTERTRPESVKPRRMFADQRGWRPLGFSPSQRRRVVVRTIVATVLIEALVAGAAAYVIDARRHPVQPQVGVSNGFSNRSAAVAGYDWAPAAYREQGAMTNGLVYTSYTGVSIRDYTGQYFNVKNRVRKSYETPLAATKKPLEVWFFGGSTMFGFDLQRDEHTIPSEVVRLAEQDGIAIHARNYGMAGYVNYQETVLLSLLVTAEAPPDLVVFYDGINDASMALLNAFGGLNPVGEPGDLGAQQQRKALASSELRQGTADPPSPLGLRPKEKPTTAADIVGDVAAVYRQGLELTNSLADRYKFDVMRFWQPDYYSKIPLDPAEKDLMAPLGLDPYRFETMVALWTRVRHALPSEVIDISDALNNMSGPILSDNIHTNERGSLAVAQSMYAHLKGKLTTLTPRG
jgi:hypothetical protein